MSLDGVYQKLTEILRDVFDEDALVAVPELTADQVDGWDSFAHLRLIFAVEKSFGVRFFCFASCRFDKRWRPSQVDRRETGKVGSSSGLSDVLYAILAWLPPALPDFRQRCRAVAQSDGECGRALTQLAGYALDENNLRRLAGVIEALRDDGPFARAAVAVSLGRARKRYVGSTDPGPRGDRSAIRPGLGMREEADFAQTMQEALSPDSTINRMKPDAVLLALDYRGLPLPPGLHDAEAASSIVAGAVAFVDALRAGFRTNSNAVSIVQTLAPPPETVFGSFDRAVPGTLRNMTAAFNAALMASVGNSEDIVFDVASLGETLGLANWHSPVQWNMAKLAFDSRFLPLYADHVCRLLGALRGKSRRCLILDLDNTVWGGVIGDDGIEGIVIGQGDATSEARISTCSAPASRCATAASCWRSLQKHR